MLVSLPPIGAGTGTVAFKEIPMSPEFDEDDVAYHQRKALMEYDYEQTEPDYA